MFYQIDICEAIFIALLALSVSVYMIIKTKPIVLTILIVAFAIFGLILVALGCLIVYFIDGKEILYDALYIRDFVPSGRPISAGYSMFLSSVIMMVWKLISLKFKRRNRKKELS
jgi:hypothetical protein